MRVVLQVLALGVVAGGCARAATSAPQAEAEAAEGAELEPDAPVLSLLGYPDGTHSDDMLWVEVPRTDACGSTAAPAEHGIPGRDEVVQVMTSFRGAVRECVAAQGIHAKRINISFEMEGASGRVQQLAATSDMPDLNRCLADAATRLCLAPFTQPQFRVKFPYKP